MVIKNISSNIKAYFNKGHERSVQAKKNIIGLIISKGLGIAISLLLVPLTINYVSPSNYGIWITLSSMVAWMSFFDIGINNGLRNRLSETFTRSDLELSQKLVSTTYAILSLIFTPLLIILVLLNPYLDWPSILHAPKDMAHDLYLVSLILFSYFCLRFILSTINIILLATQKAAQASYEGLIEQIVSLLIIFILTKTTAGSLLNLSIALCVSPIFILLGYNFFLFNRKYKNIAPKFSKVDFVLGKSLFSLGLQFFVIQIAGIIQFQTANIILIRYFGSIEVTNYNIAFKYFSVLTMFMSILMTPLWSAVTEAYAKEDYQWITSTVRKYNRLVIIIFIIGIIMLLYSELIYRLWINNSHIIIPFELSFWMLIFNLTYAYGGIYCGVLNGIGALKIQFIACLFSPFIFLAMCYLLIHIYGFGVSAIVISSIVANFNGYLLAPLQFRKLFLRKTKTLQIIG